MESLKEKNKKNARRFGMSKGRVKKFFVTAAALTALGLLGVASDSFAISQITRDGHATTTIAKEIIDPSAGFVHSGAQSIKFQVDTGIALGKTIAVQIVGGTIENIDKLQINCIAAGPVATAPTVYDPGKTWVKFTTTAAIGAGDTCTIADTTAVAPATQLTIKINPGVSSVAVTVATDDTNESPTSATNPNFYKAQQQFAMNSPNGEVWEVIDVEKDLLKFMPSDNSGILNTETTAYYDNNVAGIRAQDNSPDIKAVLISNVMVNFEVTGKMNGIASMKLIDTQGTFATADDADIATFNIDYANNKATASMKLTDLLNKWVAIKLTVNGTTPLEDRKLSINAKLVPADEVKVGTTLIDASSDQNVALTLGGFIARGKEIFNFDINGLQFVAPYVRSDSVVSSVIRVENVANRDSKVWWFVNNGGTWSLVGTDDLLKGAVLVKLGQDLINAASTKGIPLDGTKGFAVWGVVKTTDASNNKDITVYGSQQLIGGPFRPLPVQVKWPDYSH
jgi:hypothetical protein